MYTPKGIIGLDDVHSVAPADEKVTRRPFSFEIVTSERVFFLAGNISYCRYRFVFHLSWMLFFFFWFLIVLFVQYLGLRIFISLDPHFSCKRCVGVCSHFSDGGDEGEFQEEMDTWLTSIRSKLSSEKGVSDETLTALIPLRSVQSIDLPRSFV